MDGIYSFDTAAHLVCSDSNIGQLGVDRQAIHRLVVDDQDLCCLHLQFYFLPLPLLLFHRLYVTIDAFLYICY